VAESKRKVVMGGVVKVPKDALAASDETKIEEELTYETMDEETFEGFTVANEFYYLPKFWYLKRLHGHLDVEVKVIEPRGPYKPWEFNGKLRPHQATPKNPHTSTPDLAEEVRSCMGVYAEAPCGSGKTVSGLWVAGNIGGKTGVIVPSEVVFEQWISAAHRFFPDIKVGRFGGGKKELDADLVVIMLQTLYKESDRYDFDLLIADEAHLLSAPKFQMGLWNINFHYSLALTATGERMDGLGKVFRRALAYKKVTLDTDQEPVEVHMHPYEHPDYRVKEYKECGKFQLDRALADDINRNGFLVKAIVSMIKKRRRVLVLGKYKAHLAQLAQTVFDTTKTPCALFMGKTSKEEAKEVKEAMKDPRCTVFATHGKGGVGLDIEHFDCLVHALPVSDPRQYTGRIQRKAEGKATPIVIDPVDNIPQLIGRAVRRVRKGYLAIESAKVYNHARWLRLRGNHPRIIRQLI